MNLSPQNPAPVLMTGHSPPKPVFSSNSSKAGSVHFGSLPPNAINQFISDTSGVWAPKAAITRSKTQLFEDTYLEFVEDAAFYFTLPILGPWMGKGLSKLVFLQKKLHEDEGVLALKKSFQL